MLQKWILRRIVRGFLFFAALTQLSPASCEILPGPAPAQRQAAPQAFSSGQWPSALVGWYVDLHVPCHLLEEGNVTCPE